jgi:uncharacterized protein YlzI (FlbEa/FlbD family)
LEELLNNSNLWIADTGAIVHSTSNKSLSSDWVEENDTVIVMINGQKGDAVLKQSVNHVVAEKIGECLFLDIAAVFEELDLDASIETTRKGYWRIIVDEGTIFRA